MMPTASSYFGCSDFDWRGCIMFYQLNLQIETALVSCPEQRRSCAGLCRSPFRRSHLQACSSQPPSCLGFHSVFLGFGFQDYRPTYNPSSHSCFQRKKNTLKRSCPIPGQFSKQKERQRRELRTPRAPLWPGRPRAEPSCFLFGTFVPGQHHCALPMAGAGSGVP